VESARLRIDERAITVLGTDLDAVTTASLRRGPDRIPLTITAQESTRLEVAGSCLRAQPGAWGIELEVDGSDTTVLPYAVTFWRPNLLQVLSSDGSATIPFPLPNGSQQGALDVLLLPADLPPTGFPTRVELLFPEPQPAISGGWIRWRSADFAEMPDDLSQNSGWDGTVPLNAVTPSGNALILVPSSNLLLDASQPLVLSMLFVHAPGGVGAPNLLATAESVARTRTASQATLSPSAIDWNGAQPAARALWSARPALALRYPGPPSIQPGFAPEATTVRVGQPLLLNSTTTPAPTSVAWDFDGDGIIDSTESTPTATWSEPGTYTIEMIVTVQSVVDSVLCRDCVTVLPAGDPVGSSLGIF
jgi:hypothetical protein